MSDPRSQQFDPEVPLTPEEEEAYAALSDTADWRPESEGYTPDESQEQRPKSKLRSGAGDLGSALTQGGSIGDKAKNVALQAAQNSGVGGETAQNVADTVQKVNRARKAAVATANFITKVAPWTAKFFALFSNPYVLAVNVVIIIALLLIGAIVVGFVAASQVYGRQTSTGGAGASGEVLERLAQRAEWLQQNWQNYSNTGGVSAMAVAPSGSTQANEWAAACPNIVGYIWGYPPGYVGYNGINNAWGNYSKQPELFQAYAFSFSGGGNGSVTPGYSLDRPPAGAIVSSFSTSAAGHTYVMLTDELVIDNWSGGGIAFGVAGAGPRKLTDRDRAQIVGWALPVNEGFEGSFITGPFDGIREDAGSNEALPGLPEVPEWASVLEVN